jgi:hypothetical protein
MPAAAVSSVSPRSAGIAAVLGLALAIAVTGCGRKPATATPEGAVRELVDRMRRLQGDAADARAAYELLSKATQANLDARAKRYSAASGKTIAPEAMIAPSRFLLRFEPQRYAARTAGDRALVDVSGLLPGDRASVPCVFEDGGWRVDVPLPSLPPVQVRPGAER